jgi:hypothetical protein
MKDMEDFRAWMTSERGLKKITANNYASRVRALLREAGTDDPERLAAYVKDMPSSLSVVIMSAWNAYVAFNSDRGRLVASINPKHARQQRVGRLPDAVRGAVYTIVRGSEATGTFPLTIATVVAFTRVMFRNALTNARVRALQVANPLKPGEHLSLDAESVRTLLGFEEWDDAPYARLIPLTEEDIHLLVEMEKGRLQRAELPFHLGGFYDYLVVTLGRGDANANIYVNALKQILDAVPYLCSQTVDVFIKSPANVPHALVLGRTWRMFRQYVMDTFRSGVPPHEFLNALTDLLFGTPDGSFDCVPLDTLLSCTQAEASALRASPQAVETLQRWSGLALFPSAPLLPVASATLDAMPRERIAALYG